MESKKVGCKDCKSAKAYANKVMSKIKKNSKLNDLFVVKVNKNDKNAVNEVHGWTAERSDWNIVGGTIDPNKQYCCAKLWSGSGYLLNLFITEYHEYMPDMVKEIHDAFGESHNKCFPSMEMYYDAVNTWLEDLKKDQETKKFSWTKEDDDEDDLQLMAEEFAEESILPMWDYDDLCIWAENAYFSKPMSGEEVEKKLSELK